jgi:hypothetical protein
MSVAARTNSPASTGEVDVSAVNARLSDAAARGETLEVILVLRGKVRAMPAAGRWRIRVGGRHVLSFRAESVLAATPMAPPSPRRR